MYRELAERTAIRFIIRLLSIREAAQVNVRDEQECGQEQLSRSVLDQKKNKELQQMCRERAIPAYGNKNELVDRLLSFGNADCRTRNVQTPITALMKAWFLAPKSSTDMKIGSSNEGNICSRLMSFLNCYSRFYIEATKSYGLLRWCVYLARSSIFFAGTNVDLYGLSSEQKHLAFSPDDIALVVHPNGDRVFVVLEYKTRTKPNTVEKEMLLAEKWGRFPTITLSSVEDSNYFKDLIPDQGHRSQLLHNIICASLRSGFLVYASPTAIIRVVHVAVGEDVAESYLLAFTSIKNTCLDWIYAPENMVPMLSSEELGHCGDMATLKLHLNLWRALETIIEKRGRPLSVAKHTLPTAIATWNRVNGGIDVYSRYLKNVKARHLHLPPLAAIWIRFLMTLVYNAYQSTQLLQVRLSFLWGCNSPVNSLLWLRATNS